MEGSWPTRGDGAQRMAAITDRRSFERCFEEHFPVVHRYLARRVGTALADDLAAETFAIAYRRRDGYDPKLGSVRSWLYGIATNLLRNHWRAEQHLLQLDARLSSDAELREDPDLSDDRLSASLVAPKLAAALSQLTAERRDVFLLHVWGDLGTPEIGHALGIPDGTVRSRLSRARAELRERLGDFDFDLWQFETPSASPLGGSDD